MRKQIRLPKRPGPSKKTKKGGFLNRYDFAYAGQDTINQAFF